MSWRCDGNKVQWGSGAKNATVAIAISPAMAYNIVLAMNDAHRYNPEIAEIMTKESQMEYADTGHEPVR